MPQVPLGSSWLDYELHGDGAPVLLIMGMGATQGAWAGQVELLKDAHRLLTTLRQQLPHCTVIGVSHQPGVQALFDRSLPLRPDTTTSSATPAPCPAPA